MNIDKKYIIWGWIIGTFLLILWLIWKYGPEIYETYQVYQLSQLEKKFMDDMVNYSICENNVNSVWIRCKV